MGCHQAGGGLVGVPPLDKPLVHGGGSDNSVVDEVRSNRRLVCPALVGSGEQLPMSRPQQGSRKNRRGTVHGSGGSSRKGGVRIQSLLWQRQPHPQHQSGRSVQSRIPVRPERLCGLFHRLLLQLWRIGTGRKVTQQQWLHHCANHKHWFQCVLQRRSRHLYQYVRQDLSLYCLLLNVGAGQCRKNPPGKMPGGSLLL